MKNRKCKDVKLKVYRTPEYESIHEEMKKLVCPCFAFVETKSEMFEALTLAGALRLWAERSKHKEVVVQVGTYGGSYDIPEKEALAHATKRVKCYGICGTLFREERDAYDAFGHAQ